MPALFKTMIMKGTYIVTIGLLLLDLAVMLLARWFDRRYYVPFLNTVMNKQRKEPEYNPQLIRLGLLAAGGGLLAWSLIGCCIWLSLTHKF